MTEKLFWTIGYVLEVRVGLIIRHNNKDVEEARYIKKNQIYKWLLAMLILAAR